MPELKIYAKTYYGNVPEEQTEARKLAEFDFPDIPIVIRPADGVRIALGTHDFWNLEFPDIQIERRPGGWAVFIHAVPGDDPSGFVYILDDGRSYVNIEHGSSLPLRFLEEEEMPPELDRLPE